MPVVINELTITVDAQPRDEAGNTRPNASVAQDDRTKVIIRECIDAVMDTLRNKSER